MMKTINVTFTKEEHEQLIKAKGDLSWHDYIMKLTHKDGRKNS